MQHAPNYYALPCHLTFKACISHRSRLLKKESIMDRLLFPSVFSLSISWCADTHSTIRRATQEVLSVFRSLSSSKTAVSAAMWSIACASFQIRRPANFKIMGFQTTLFIFINKLFQILYIKWLVFHIFGSHCFNFP
jgi:hypothetical protein